MTGQEYQKHAQKTALYPKSTALYYLTLGLTGEAGEVANKVKKIIRDDNQKITPERTDTLKQELGDILWYIAMLCTELNLSLDEVMQANIDKLASRYDRQTINGQGDTR